VTDADAGANTSAGPPVGGHAGDRRSPERADSPTTARAVTQLAERNGFGQARGTHTLGGGDVGCMDLLLATVLLVPGIGLLVGPPYGTAATAARAGFVALAAVLPLAALRYETRRDDRIRTSASLRRWHRHDVSGASLCSPGDAVDTGEIVRIAIAAGAQSR
jgi:hypothetical protein